MTLRPDGAAAAAAEASEEETEELMVELADEVEDDEPLDEERGDYKAFDGPPAAGSTEKRPASTGPNVPGNEDARQASLKKLKDRGWNT